MIRYRPFRNTDPPQLVEVWHACAPGRPRVKPLSIDRLEAMVLSKPYFEPKGLIVAEDEETGKPVGFVHAAFGPTEDQSNLSTYVGCTCMLMVRPEYRRRGIARRLLELSEEYLRSRGAAVLYAGGIRPLSPFYMGLYGDSDLPGVLDSDADAQALFTAADYREVDHCLILHLDLARFRPLVDRDQIQIRRRTKVTVTHDPQAQNWWDAGTFGAVDRTRYDLRYQTGEHLATATIWSTASGKTAWGRRPAGLIDIQVHEAHRRKGLAVFLLGEIFRQLAQEGFGVVEVTTVERNAAAQALYEKLGFKQIDGGRVYRKD